VESLVGRIPEVAHDENGFDAAESRLADEILARGAAAIPLLLPLLEDQKPAVRDVAGYIVSRIAGLGEEHLEALIAASKAGNGWVAYGIGRIGTPRAVAFLVEDLLARPQSDTQVTGGLVAAGPPAAAALASVFERDFIPWVDEFSAAACEIFSEMANKAAIAAAPLAAVARSSKIKLVNRKLAVRLIGCIGLPAAGVVAQIRALAKAHPGEFGAVAEDAIVAIGSRDAVPVFRKRLESAPDVILLRDLAQAGRPVRDAGPSVVPLLSHAQREVRLAAARALGFIDYQPAVRALKASLSDRADLQLVRIAAESLGRLGNRSALHDLEMLAGTHWYPPVRAAAEKARAAITGRASYQTPLEHREFASFFFEYEHDDNQRFRASSSPAFSSSEPLLTDAERAMYVYETRFDANAPESPDEHRVRVTPAVGLKIAKGVLLGSDRGEWGGELVYVDRAGRSQIVARQNVQSIHQLGRRLVVVAGLAHLLTDEGRLEEVVIDSRGTVHTRFWRALPGAPEQSGIVQNGSLFVRCTQADVIIDPDGTMRLAP